MRPPKLQSLGDVEKNFGALAPNIAPPPPQLQKQVSARPTGRALQIFGMLLINDAACMRSPRWPSHGRFDCYVFSSSWRPVGGLATLAGVTNEL
jgi:hypothetical protein